MCDNLDRETENHAVIFEDRNIKFEIKRHDPYDSVPADHVGKTEVKLLDPINSNSFSYKSVGRELKQIHADSGREWVIVGYDGLLYKLGIRVIDNTYCYYIYKFSQVIGLQKCECFSFLRMCYKSP